MNCLTGERRYPCLNEHGGGQMDTGVRRYGSGLLSEAICREQRWFARRTRDDPLAVDCGGGSLAKFEAAPAFGII